MRLQTSSTKKMGLCPNVTACFRKRWFVLWLVLTVSTGLLAAADKRSNEKFTTESRKASPRPGRLPHLHIDQKKRFVDLDATVLQALDGQWLELLACTRRGRDHESILLVHADPSHVHLALIVLGLKPGSPMSWVLTEDGVALDRLPSGPRISVSALYMVDDKQVEVPVNEWIYNQHTHKPLADNIWLFAGSKFVQIKGKEVYLADVNGSVLSLVNFGDELLARSTRLTNKNDEEAWAMVKDRVPPAGTKVVLRLRPVEPDKQPDKQKEGSTSKAIEKPKNEEN